MGGKRYFHARALFLVLVHVTDYFELQCLSAGINIFLDGFVPTENLRFRDASLVFKVAETADKVGKFMQY